MYTKKQLLIANKTEDGTSMPKLVDVSILLKDVAW